MKRPSTVLLAAALVLGVAWLPDGVQASSDDLTIRLERRGLRDELRGVLLDMDARGIRMRSDRLGEMTVTWDRVRAVGGEAGADPRIDGWLADGTRLWRARIRLERGDPLAAEPLLEELAERFDQRDDAMARLVFEGLLQCRIARGAHDEAIVPLLHVLRLRPSVGGDAGADPEGDGGSTGLVDDTFGLVPAVPPAWHRSADRRRIEAQIDGVIRRLAEAGRSPTVTEDHRARLLRVAAVAACYREAIRREHGEDAGPLPDPADDPGLRLLVQVIDGRDPGGTADPARDGPDTFDDGAATEAERLAAARRLLEPSDELARDRGQPAWVLDWRAFFDGRRGLAADDVVVQDQGLVRLLRVPALHGVQRPYLAGLALATATDHLRASGRPAEADVLQADLDARFRGHPDASPDATPRPESLDP